MTIGNTTIERNESAPSHSNAEFPSRLPLFLNINHLKTATIHYITPTQTIDIEQFSLQGHLYDGVWLVDNYDLKAEFGQINGSGIVDTSSIGLTFAVNHFSPFIDLPDWSADISVDGQIFLSSDQQNLSLNNIKGEWMDKIMSGRWDIKQSGGNLNWEGYIDLNENHLSSEGHLGDTPEISWLIYAPDLQRLIPNAKGHFFSDGLLSSEALTANVDIDQFSWGRFEVMNLEAHLNGTESDHHLQANGFLNAIPLSVDYKGTQVFERIEGAITAAKIRAVPLKSPVNVLLSAETQRISRACFENKTHSACLDYEAEGEEWTFNVNAQNLSLESFNTFLPADFSVAGNASFDIGIERAQDGQFLGKAEAQVLEGEWEWVDKAGRQYNFPITTLNASLNGVDEVSGHLFLEMSEHNSLDGQININFDNAERWWDAPVEGLFTIIAADLDAIEFIAPSIEVLTGQVIGSFVMGGTLTSPVLVESHAVLNQVNIPLFEPNTALFVETLNLEGLPDEVIRLDGSGQMGEGHFTVEGVIDLSDKRPKVSIAINGDKLMLIDTDEYHIVASVDMQYNSSAVNGAILRGNVSVDEATIALNDRASARRLSDDVTITNTHATPVLEDDNTLLSTFLTIDIPNEVPFSGFGLNAKFTGQLKVVNQPSQDYTKANGRLNISAGEYKAFGRTFVIQTGDIFYNGGPIRNPTVDIRADRLVEVKQAPQPVTTSADDADEGASHHTPQPRADAETVLVGLALKGPLRQPHISFYSEPPMNDGDIVSYLFIGRPQDQASAAQAELLFQAVSELMPFAGTGHLGEKFGLDELGLTHLSPMEDVSDSFLENTALVVGKQISDRLYIRYIRGLSNTIDTVASDFQIRLFLGKHFTLEGNADSNGYGGDIVFSIDRP
jgi:translocation and assembly module TamB